jgi:hypothetical protein
VKRGRRPLDPRDPSVSLTVRLPSRQFDALCRRALQAQTSVPAEVRRVLRRAQKRISK